MGKLRSKYHSFYESLKLRGWQGWRYCKPKVLPYLQDYLST